jgi:hypothetical protein
VWWAGFAAYMAEKRGVFRVFVGKLEGKTPHRIWEHNIKMDLKAVGWEGMDWINVSQDWDK